MENMDGKTWIWEKDENGDVALCRPNRQVFLRYDAQLDEFERFHYDRASDIIPSGITKVGYHFKSMEEFMKYGEIAAKNDNPNNFDIAFQVIDVDGSQKYNRTLESFSEIGNAMKNDGAMILKSPSFGDVLFSNGVFGDLSKKNNGGYGINHIVEGRYIKDGLSKEDIASLLYLIKETVETTEVEVDETKTRQNIVKNGISVTLRKDFDGVKQNWIVTGFAENDEKGVIKKEATDAIKAVNAQYGYAPEHLFVSEQVGAIIASLNNIAQNIKKSNDTERIKNFKEVYKGTQFIKEHFEENKDMLTNEEFEEMLNQRQRENMQPGEAEENKDSVPELKAHKRLKEEDVKNLEIITDEEFSDIIDSMLLNDYRNIPNVIRLPNIRADLAERLGLEKDAAFIMKNGISHIRPNRKGKYGQGFSDEEYRMIPQVLREATFAVIDNREKNFQIVFDDIESDLKQINKIVLNKDKLGNYIITVGKVEREFAFNEKFNDVVGVGVAPTIYHLRFNEDNPATRLRPSPTTEDIIAQDENPVNKRRQKSVAANFVLEKLAAANIEVISDKSEMRSILDSGKALQKMSAYHGTPQEMAEENKGSVPELKIFEQLDDYLKKGIQPKGNKFIMSQTPSILQYAGIRPLEIELSTSVINKAKKRHGLSNEEIIGSVKKISDPLLIFNTDKNASENKKESIIIITDEEAKGSRKPVAITMNIGAGDRHIVNAVTSVHDRNLIAKNGVNILNDWKDRGLLRYADDKKISSIAKAVPQSEPDIQEQFLLPLANLDIKNVPCKSDFVNATESINSVVGVGVAPTIQTLKMGASSTRLRASPATDKSITEEARSVNKASAKEIAANFVLEKLAAANIEVISDKSEMRSILDSGKALQKMSAYHGTPQEMAEENLFGGYGTYVVSVSEDRARQQGMKIAARKYGDAFYVKDQTLKDFLAERSFSPYWSSFLNQQGLDDVTLLQDSIMRADLKGNAELERQRGQLLTLASLGIIEHKRENTYLYSIDIPDNNGENYLPYNSPIGIERATRINGALEGLGSDWKVSRNDSARQVYFNTLSEKVFSGDQEAASKFLHDAGFVGMEMNNRNYIVFNEGDISVNKRVQYMRSESGEVYGFTCDGRIYLDPDLMNSNTPVHEYTHLWDRYTQESNPGLWERGKEIFKGTHLWQEVASDPGYREIADDDDLILSEVHSRICGKIAERVLERIAREDGEIARDRAIDWNQEAWEYIAKELGNEIQTPELGSEKYTEDSLRQAYIQEFLSKPMKDLMAGKEILRGREKTAEMSKDDEEYIRSPEFIEKFGDWEKANRLEKLKESQSLEGDKKIVRKGKDITSEVNGLREFYSKENLKKLQDIATDLGDEILANYREKQGLNQYQNPVFRNENTGKEFTFQTMGIKEIRHHNIFQFGHIEAMQSIPEIINKAVYIGEEKNEDNRNPFLERFYYYGCGIKIAGDDFTCKVVFTQTKDGQLFYDQSLSTIEKGRFLDIMQQKNKPEVFNPQQKGWDNSELYEENKNPFNYYDKRLIQICQVPQMPYLEQNKDGRWLPTKEAVEAVRNGDLMMKKEGQVYEMVGKSTSDEKEAIQKMAVESKVDNPQENATAEAQQNEDLEYIHSPEFIEKFGDWEKANRLEKLKESETIVSDGKIVVEGEEISENLDYLREDKNRKLLQILARDLGRQVVGIYHNDDLNIDVKVSMNNIDEIKHHNILFENHVEAIKNIPEIIQRAIYIGKEDNSDKKKHPDIMEYKYFGTGLKIDGVDYTCKSVIGVDKNGNNYYDQSLSTIEKGRFADIIMQKNKLGNLSPLISPWESESVRVLNSSNYYDKRLIQICQVPQMPYLEQNKDGRWQPTKEAVEAVRNGTLRVEKEGQTEIIVDEARDTQAEEIQKMESPTAREASAEQAATNFLMQRLSKAGVEVVSDNQTFENLLAYVNEVNICLEMMDEDSYPIQTMDEKDEASLPGMSKNRLPIATTLHNKYTMDSEKKQAVLNGLSNLSTSIANSSNLQPKEFLDELKKSLGFENDSPSNYITESIGDEKYRLRISNHSANAYHANLNEKTTSVVVQLASGKFRGSKERQLVEFVYNPENLTKEKMQGIILGIQDWIQTGEYTDKNFDKFYVSPKERLQQNIAEQLTLGGIKKGVLTGIAALSLASAMPKLSAETNYDLSRAQTEGIVQVQSKNVGISHFTDDSGKKYMKVINYNEEEGGSNDICFYIDASEEGKESVRFACNASDLYSQAMFEETRGLQQSKKGREKLYTSTVDIPVEVYNSIKSDELFLALSSPKGWSQEQLARKASLLTGNGSYVAQKMIQDSLTYGFVLNSKIYLNPEIVNSNVIAHEYTHIWDKYTQAENPDLWERGKDVFKRTSLWNEVIEDENYSSIKNNEDLVLSECHARVCGRFAQEVLNKVAAENGNEVKEEVVNWDKEVERFIAREFGMENPAAEMSSEEEYKHFKDFLSQPMKDLMAGKEILRGREKTAEMSKDDEEYIHSPEFIEKFGDWEKVNRLEKLKGSQSLGIDNKIYIHGIDETERINELRNNPSDENLRELSNLVTDMGKEMLKNLRVEQNLNGFAEPVIMVKDDEKKYKFNFSGIKEAAHHNLYQKGHIEGIFNIPTIISNAIYIGKEKNEDNRKPELERFYYYALGIKLESADYTAKVVFTENKNGEIYYDQSLSTIEKGKFVDIIKNKLVAVNPINRRDSNEFSDEHPSAYYDKRLYQICQVPQMPYLEQNKDGRWQPTKEAVEAVRNGDLMMKKEGQVYEMVGKSTSDEKEAIQKMAVESKVDNPQENATAEAQQNEENKTSFNSETDIVIQGKFQSENGEAFKALDDYLEQGTRPKNDEFIFSSVPEALNAAGISPNEIVIKTSVINKAMREHGLSVREVREAVQNISNPVLIFNTDSASENKKKSILALTDVFAQNGKPVAFAMNLDDKFIRGRTVLSVNQITSVHDRTLVAKNGTDLIQKWTNEGNCIYVDDKKISDWQLAAGVQFPLAVLQSDAYTILAKSDFVKQISSDEKEAIQKMAVESKVDNPQENATAEAQQNEDEVVQNAERQTASLDDEKRVNMNSTENALDKSNDDRQQDALQAAEEAEKDKDTLPSFALITRDGLKMFNNCKVQAFDSEEKKYIVANERGDSIKIDGATLDSIQNPKNSIDTEQDKSIETAQTQSAIVAGKTRVPEFAMITQNGLKEFKGMVVQKYSPSEKMWTLSNSEGEKVSVSENTFRELTSENQRNRAKEFDENTPAYKKMLETQYNDYFKQRENTASNFIHNLAVYSRKEANSPIDAIRLSSVIIKQMSPGEKQKTKELLKTLCKDGETINSLIANTYLEAVKDKPLNEEYILSGRYKDTIVRPMYDTISAKGEKVDKDFKLRVGDTVSNVSFKSKKMFGAGSERMVADWTVISASKEGNVITLKSGNSFKDVPRDTFLKQYSKQEKGEQKQQVKERKRNALKMNIER